MFLLVNNKLKEVSSYSNRDMKKTAFFYLFASLFCAIFGAVYEYFSHDVFSFYMIYAFLLPLAGGVLPFLCMDFFSCKKLPNRLSCHLYHFGIATLTVGSIFQGVLEIYGTTNVLIRVYWVFGGWFLGMGILVYLFRVFYID
ncbi:MAG: hypothetical protein ACI4F9_02010 [Lachnospiraceae bacterium]